MALPVPDEADLVGVLVSAVETRDIDHFKAAVSSVREKLSLEEVVEHLMAPDNSGDSRWARVVRNAGIDHFSAMVSCLPDTFTGAQVHKLLLSRFSGKSLLSAAFKKNDAPILRTVLKCLKEAGSLEGNQVVEKEGLDSTFATCAERSLKWEGELRHAALDVLSYLLANYARPSPDDLLQLSRRARHASDRRFQKCCLSAVASAANPFIPGMFLSVGLTDAAEKASEGEKERLVSIQNYVDSLLLKILERLPQTVRGFHGGVDGCCAVFEPEYVGSIDTPTSIQGPLRLALERRQQAETYCDVPLVVDFLSRRFTRGLPNLRDTDGVLRDQSDLGDLGGATKKEVENGLGEADGSTDGDEPPRGPKEVFDMLLDPRALLRGETSGSPSLTWLPGAQFITAGLVAKPSSYYRVPAMRMMLDLVVYLGLLAEFSIVVLFDEDGSRTLAESLVAAYIVAGCIREGREVWRDTRKYFQDRWNIIDVLSLLLLAAGLTFRLAAGSSQWGRALYALSAPLIFSRVLFFVQILRFQGPMVEVIFSMTTELARFGIVMLVIMLGFAVSFHALFHDEDTFSETLLDLFKAMLGDVDFFDDFSQNDNNAVATILLVVYLFIITIMLLNLLVAILSTSHARVQENAEQEFRVSKARMIQRYRQDVDKHLLPAPFNLVQLALACPFLLVDCRLRGKTYTGVKESVGRLVFWLVLGPLAVVAGSLLWMTSVLTFTFARRKYYSEQTKEVSLEAQCAQSGSTMANIRYQEKGRSQFMVMTLSHLVLGLWCLVGAPMCLLFLWLRNLWCIPVGAVAGVRWLCTALRSYQKSLVDTPGCQSEPGEASPTDETKKPTKKRTIDAMLRNRPGDVGVEGLLKYLKDPMSDREVRHDEKTKGVTVEHLKLLRNRLENAQTATKARLEQLEKESADTKRERAEMKGMFESLLTALGGTQPELVEIASGSHPSRNGACGPESETCASNQNCNSMNDDA